MNPPETFAQLMAKSTRGPYTLRKDADKATLTGANSEIVFHSYRYDDFAPMGADQELIARLLNFAHSGGVELIHALAGGVNQITAQHVIDAEKLLKTINNPTK